MNKKKCRVIQVITDGVADEFCRGTRIIATGTAEQLGIYKKQLIESGHTEELTIESREIEGRNNSIRIQGYELVEHGGMLYPKRNVDMAYKAAVKQSKELSNTLACLNELKSGVSEKDDLNITETMIIVSLKIEQISAKKFDIDMM